MCSGSSSSCLGDLARYGKPPSAFFVLRNMASESSVQLLLPFFATKARLTVISWTGYPIVVLLGALNTTQTVRT